MNERRRRLLKGAAEAIRAANSVVLACHVRPDADALGSLLGLRHLLAGLGKHVCAVSPDGVPQLYRFLPGWEEIVTDAAGRWDLGIGLDADGSDRLGPAEAAVLACPVVIDLDHHTGPDPYGQIQVVDPTAAATGELVYHLAVELGAPVTPAIARCLMAALLTDTGSFRFTNVTDETFRIAAALVAAGAHPAPVYEAVYGSRPFAASRLLGALLAGLQRSAGGRIVWGSLEVTQFQALGLETDATEGFVDQIRMVEGCEVALFFREEASGEVRVSLRSRGAVNVARAAECFGGGGHAAAAGCCLPGPLDRAVPPVLAAVERQLLQA